MKVFLAAFETEETHIQALYDVKPPFVLSSFYYLNKLKQEKLINFMEHIHENTKDFILDSGAFSMLNTKGADDRLDEYINEYINFIKKYNIKNFIELDIDKIVGYDKVKEIRNKIENEVGRQCIPVWHMSRGMEEFEKLTREYKYVAVGGIAIKDIKKKHYPILFPVLLNIARKNNCKLHALGFTGKEINDYSFYSVDSSTWTGGNRFGKLHIFNAIQNRIISKNISDTKRVKKGIETRYKITLFNVREWKKLQEYSYTGDE